MKKLLMLLSAVLLAVSVNAAGLNFLKDKTVAEAQKEAQKAGKILMVDVYAEWCGPCKRLAANVFPSAEVEVLNSKIVALKLNAEEGEGTTYAKEWKVGAYPTIIFFKNGKEIARMVGAPSNPADFVKEVNQKLDDASKK